MSSLLLSLFFGLRVLLSMCLLCAAHVLGEYIHCCYLTSEVLVTLIAAMVGLFESPDRAGSFVSVNKNCAQIQTLLYALGSGG